MRGKSIKIAMAVSWLFLYCVWGFSQIRESGTIHGNVTDIQGEPLPGVKVSISGLKLIGKEKAYITDAAGYYRFASIPVGPYTVSVELDGFQKIIREGIDLHANMSLTVDFKLKQAEVKEVIVVSGKSPTVDITSSSAGAMVMSDELLMALPTKKEFGQLLALASGTELTSMNGHNVLPSYGMGHGESNAYQFDGIDVSSQWGAMEFSPDFNTIQEATASGLGLPAEFGGFVGSVLTAISKSGANRFSTLAELWYNGRSWNSQNLGNIPAEKFFDPADKDKKFEAGSYLDFGLQLGGRIIRDKLWFFLSSELLRTKEYPLATPSVRRGRTSKAFAKLTYQLNPSMRMNLSTSYDDERMENSDAGPFTSPEAETNLRSPGALFDLNLTSTLSPNSILELKLGYNIKTTTIDPKQGRDMPGHGDWGSSISTVNAMYYNAERTKSLHCSVHLSQYFPELFLGSHDMKIGAEFISAAPLIMFGYSGGVSFYDINGQPFQKMVYNPAYTEKKHYYSTGTIFSQDSWRVSKRMTLNLGLRYDRLQYKIPVVGLGVIYSGGSFSPRLGFAFDVLGDRKNVVKFHYGHYFDKLSQTYFANADQRGIGFDAYSWMGSDWELLYSYNPMAQPYRIDDNIKQPYVREISVAFERELFRDASLSLNFYYRKLGRAIGDINTTGRWQKSTIVNPGFDGIAGTSDDMGTLDVYDQLNPGEDSYVFTNPRKGQSEAVLEDPKFISKGLEIIFNKKFSNRWQILASYNYSHVRGNTNSTGYFNGINPNYSVNADGEQGYMYGQPHQLRFQGNVLLPWDIDLGLSAMLSSGSLRSATYYHFFPSGMVSPLNIFSPGTYKYPFRKLLDLRVQKQFDLARGKLSLMADVFNLLNSNKVLSDLNMVGPDYGKIWLVTSPRTFRIGLRFTY